MILHFCYVQLVLQLRNSDLHLLQFAPRFLLMLALAAAILQPRFARLPVFQRPCASLASADFLQFVVTAAFGFSYVPVCKTSPAYTISSFTCAICLRLFRSGVRSFHLA